jgi:subfamily B ATP-binding cassette protein HlyB/CyaB
VVIDQVIGNNNPPLLAPLAAILIVAAIASSILGGIRALLSADLSDRVDVRMGSSVVEHLMRLPLSYFEQRQVGNILFNVNQLYSIRQFLVDQLLGVGLDTILAIIFLVIIFWLSPTLTLVVISVVPLLALINLASSPVLIRWIKASKKFGSQASTYLYEVVGGMRTVKSQNFEVESRWHWLERYRKYTTARFRLTQLSSLIKETSSFITKGARYSPSGCCSCADS